MAKFAYSTKALGKNLLDPSKWLPYRGYDNRYPVSSVNITKDYVEGISYTDGGMFSQVVDVDPNSAYTLSFETNQDVLFYVYELALNTIVLGAQQSGSIINTGSRNKLLIGLYLPYPGNRYFRLSKIQLEKGIVKTPYEPYVGNSQSSKRTGTTVQGLGEVEVITPNLNANFSKISTANFLNKDAGSTGNNAHVVRYSSNVLVVRAGGGSEATQAYYDAIKQAGDSKLFTASYNGGGTAGFITQQQFGFNLIRHIEDTYGPIPATTTQGKVDWIRNNVSRVSGSWTGNASSANSTRSQFSIWSTYSSSWVLTVAGNGDIKKLTINDSSAAQARVDDDGFVYFAAYADPSDGTVASAISTDYMEMEIELKKLPGATPISDDFKNKVSGSVIENPHIIKHKHAQAYTLYPNQFTAEIPTTWYNDLVANLDGVTARTGGIGAGQVSGDIAQQLFSFNIIEAVKRQTGAYIPGSTVAQQVAWLKANVLALNAEWYGYGRNAYYSQPIKKDDFTNKVMGSTVENPHIAKYRGGTLDTPSSFTSENTQLMYDKIKSLDGNPAAVTDGGNGASAKSLFAFNLIELIKRKYGFTVPGDTDTKRQTWLRENVKTVTCNWHGFGSSATGNKATLAIWRIGSQSWASFTSHYNSSISIRTISETTYVTDRIDLAGNVYFMAYAEPSDGATPSTINTDFVEFEVELLSKYKATLNMWDNVNSKWSNYPISNTSSTPVKTVSSWTNMNAVIGNDGFANFIAYSEPCDGVNDSFIYTDYVKLNLILKDGLIYTKGHGILSNPSISYWDKGSKKIIGKNLLTNNEVVLDVVNTLVVETIPVKPNTKYTFSFYADCTLALGDSRMRVDMMSGNTVLLYGGVPYTSGGNKGNVSYTFTTQSNCDSIKLLKQAGSGFTGGKSVFTNIQLEEGDKVTSFEPYGLRNKRSVQPIFGQTKDFAGVHPMDSSRGVALVVKYRPSSIVFKMKGDINTPVNGMDCLVDVFDFSNNPATNYGANYIGTSKPVRVSGVELKDYEFDLLDIPITIGMKYLFLVRYVSSSISINTMNPSQQNNLPDYERYYGVGADYKNPVLTKPEYDMYYFILKGINKPAILPKKAFTLRDDFSDKVLYSTVENPHIARGAASTTLNIPTSSGFKDSYIANNPIRLQKLDGSSASTGNDFNGYIAQQLFSFDIVKLFERKYGLVPGADIATKIKWLKDNIIKITANWYGYGSGPNGNKANFTVWSKSMNAWWTSPKTHSSATASILAHGEQGSTTSTFNDDGIMHFLAYSDPSNGAVASMIYTDYIELVVETKEIPVLGYNWN